MPTVIEQMRVTFLKFSERPLKAEIMMEEGRYRWGRRSVCQDQVTVVELLMKTVLLRCVVTVSSDALNTFSWIYWWFKVSQISAICCQGSHQKPATWLRPSCRSSIWQTQQEEHNWENEKSKIGSNIRIALSASPYVRIRPVVMWRAKS